MAHIQTITERQPLNDAMIQLATRQMIDERKNADEVINNLIAIGTSEQDAKIIVDKLNTHREHLLKKKAKQNIAFGFMWCVGGVLATTAQIQAGFVAAIVIVLGFTQLVKGVVRFF